MKGHQPWEEKGKGPSLLEVGASAEGGRGSANWKQVREAVRWSDRELEIWAVSARL